MKAVARLILMFVAGTPLQLGLLMLGLVFVSLGLTGYLFYPTWSLGTGMSRLPLWYQSSVLVAPWLGLILLFFASARLPTIVERLALGRTILLLPGGRVRLLLAAVVTASLIALLTATAGTLSFFYYPNELKPERVFSRTWIATFSNVSLMYAALWIVGKTRGIWLLLGSLLVILGILLPLGLIGRPSGLPALVWAGIAVWVTFAALLLFGSRLRHAFGRAAFRFALSTKRFLPTASYSSGAELDLLLGTSRPWVVAIGQAVPVGAAVWLIDLQSVWLLYLTLFSAISGAITSTAAARSRALWLRFGWTRTEMFARVEAAYWRYNAYALGVLLLLFIAMGTYRDVATPVLGLGLASLALSNVVSSYLGLLMTRGLGWRETALGVLTMGLIMLTAVAVGKASDNLLYAIELAVALAGLVVVYRLIAKRRWIGLDWMVCRNSPLTRGAG
jgi:hypothetical protein